jgi:hypothetical protein
MLRQRCAAIPAEGGGPSRLADQVALGVLTRTYPPELVDRVLAETGRTERRHRLLPARLMVYYVLALALFAGVGMVEVLRCLVEALRETGTWRHPREPWRRWHLPAKSALIQARARLGPEPLAALHASAVGPLATAATPGAWYRAWRLMSVDGTCLDVADTPANDAAFGRPGSSRGEQVGAFPQVRLVGLGECGTHAIVAAKLGPFRGCGEGRLADGLLGELTPEMLVMVDRGLWSTARWRRATATGAALLWRVKRSPSAGAPALPVDQALPDGSWRSHLAADGGDPIAVRVVDYRLDDPGYARRGGHGSRGGARDLPADQPMVYRLVTSILDCELAPAAELAALYHQRWEIETTLAELKLAQRGRGAVLRSKIPDGVTQEVWAHLLVHYALRSLMHQVALAHGWDPDRVSFTATLRIVRRHTITRAVFSP